jgi:hypothetical protein
LPYEPWSWKQISSNSFDRINAQKVLSRNWRRRVKYRKIIEYISGVYNIDYYIQQRISYYCMNKY